MKKLIPLFVCSLIIAGCSTPPPATVNTIRNANSTANIKRVMDRRVMTDSLLDAAIAVMEIRESKTNDDYKRIQVFLKNISVENCSVAYVFHWYDENGAEVESPDENIWQRKTILAGDDAVLTTVAPERNCSDFKLRFKRLDGGSR